MHNPSLLCRIIGHKWNLVEKRQRPKVRAADPNEDIIVDTFFTPITHCHRCGVPNPAFPDPRQQTKTSTPP